MKYIDEFILEACDWLVAAKRGNKVSVKEITSLEPQLLQEYAKYLVKIKEYKVNLSPSGFNQHYNLMKDFYDSPSVALKAYIQKRRCEHQLAFCPYCGKPTAPDTLDHFIPKKQWPEFAIFSNNLVPQCRSCAPIKGEKYYDLEEKCAYFLHPFYNEFLDNFRFKIKVEFDEITKQVTFNVTLLVVKQVSDEDKARVLKHVTALKVKKRIVEFCARELKKWESLLLQKNFSFRRALTQRLSEHDKKNIGRDWKTAFYEGMISNMSLLDYMDTLQPSLTKQPPTVILSEINI
ncbi:HNH endonuclease [Wohlfahrtiimonas populi]|uniref:HNH endonuclease n=1 Tax=Wohlfahrtiimonas populi TaxID=1940240 RepID=UPI00098D06A4|nr:HNH endonuclease [Wohlfahrtiimonas populi]